MAIGLLGPVCVYWLGNKPGPVFCILQKAKKRAQFESGAGPGQWNSIQWVPLIIAAAGCHLGLYCVWLNKICILMRGTHIILW